VGLRRHLNAVFDSWVVGVAKPNPEIFKMALDHLGVSAPEAIMVGDTPAADVLGAQAAGVRAVLIDPYDLHPAAGVPRFRDLPAFVNSLLAAGERTAASAELPS
jgi:putative hydrolase of the HAD superfamily